MSPDAQYVYVTTVAQSLGVPFSRIDLVSITVVGHALIAKKDLQIVFTVSYYGATTNTTTSVYTALASGDFLTTLHTNAANYSTSTSNAFSSVSTSSTAVNQNGVSGIYLMTTTDYYSNMLYCHHNTI
jgi:hypothetical protein